MRVKVSQHIYKEWNHIPGNGFNSGWACPVCGKVVWLDLGFSPEDYDYHYCPCCGEPLIEHGGIFKGWTK